MTDEQIKQNAEAYAMRVAESHITGKRPAYVAAFNAFMSGAHSLDEEIDELKGEIERQKAIIAVDDLNEDTLRKELDQLRNPWISVNDKLPEEDHDDKGYSVEVLGLFPDGSASKCFCSIEEGIWLIDGLTCDKPTHWMPIPQIPKGGEHGNRQNITPTCRLCSQEDRRVV